MSGLPTFLAADDLARPLVTDAARQLVMFITSPNDEFFLTACDIYHSAERHDAVVILLGAAPREELE